MKNFTGTDSFQFILDLNLHTNKYGEVIWRREREENLVKILEIHKNDLPNQEKNQYWTV